MAREWYQSTAYEDACDREHEYVLRELNKYQQEAFKEIASVVSTDTLNRFARLLADAYLNGDEDAESIAQLLQLEQAHFEAIAEDYDEFASSLYKKHQYDEAI